MLSINGTDFEPLNPSDPRCELDFIQGAMEEKIDEFHLIGVDGSYSSRGGRVGQNLGCLLRYRSTSREDTLALFFTDLYGWTGVAPFDIDGPDGNTYSRCRYLSHTIRNRGPVGDGSGDFFLIVEAQFRCLGISG